MFPVLYQRPHLHTVTYHKGYVSNISEATACMSKIFLNHVQCYGTCTLLLPAIPRVLESPSKR